MLKCALKENSSFWDLLETFDLVDLVSAITLSEWKATACVPFEPWDIPYRVAAAYIELFSTIPSFYNELCKKAHNKSVRVSRLKKRISKMMKYPCVFLTLTFSDDVLSNTSSQSRKDYVRKYLKANAEHYVANIDFGSDKIYIDSEGTERQATEREHFHALVVADSVNLSMWKQGAVNAERLRPSSSPLRIARYIDKLTLHATKATTKANRVIFSKGLDKL